MSAENLQKFLDDVRKDPDLQHAFTEAITRLADKAGHNVTEQDVQELLEQLPRTRPVGEPVENPHDQQRAKDWDELYETPVATTMAAGEEERRGDVSTMAIGEEDKSGRMRDIVKGSDPKKDGKPQRDTEVRLTTLAMGEEGRKPRVPQPK